MSYNTAWHLKHKILQVMCERCEGGRGAAGKIPFVTAVETSDDGRPLKARFRRVSGFTRAVIEDYAQAGPPRPAILSAMT